MADNISAGGPRGAVSARISVPGILASALGDAGTLWRLFLAFLLWFATAAVPWVNIGTTLGLFAIVRDVGRGRPVSPIDVFDASNRARIVPGLATLGLSLAALAGAVLFGAVAAFHAGVFFAAFPGWTVAGAALPCPCLAETPWQKAVSLVVAACGFVPALVLASAWAFALPVFADTGECGAKALRRSRELVAGNHLSVLVLLMVPAVVALAVPLAVAACGGSVFAVFAGETVAAVLAMSVAGRTYGALLAARGETGAAAESGAAEGPGNDG